MRILIIGSKGFIGSHCYKYFSEKEYNVSGCDVVIDYTEKKYFLIVASNSDFHTIFEKNSFDVCINCSGAANVSDSIKNPRRDFFLNTVNVFSILYASREYNPTCKFLNISSAAVYGRPIGLPIVESFKLNPISPYGIHKKISEEICSEFYNQFNINTCSIRIFSAFGPGLKKQLFWDIYKKSKKFSKK